MHVAPATEASTILLVKLNYAHKRWTFPGGGVARGESPTNAALRELTEETGIRISQANKIGEYFSTAEYKRDTVHVFATVAPNRATPIVNGIEIQKAAWFLVRDLPEGAAPSVDRIIAMSGLGTAA